MADYRAVRARQVRLPEGQPIDPTGEFLNGTFLAEGELVVRLLLRSGFATRSVFLTPTRLGSLADDLAVLPEHVPVFVADPGVMGGVVGFNIHRGVLACGDRGESMPPSKLLASQPKGLVLLEDLANADNVGAIFRNTAALAQGFGIVLSPGCCDPLYRKAIRVSVGHILRVPFAVAANWQEALAQVRRAGYTLIALTLDAGSVDIGSLPPVSRPAILVGTEGAGVSRVAQGLADVSVRVPMAPGVDSLNVGVATGIALHRLAGRGL